MNKKYERRYNKWKQMKHYMNDFYGMFTNAHLQLMFKDEYNAELTEEYKRVFPRRKKVDLTKLPEENIEPIKIKWQERTLRAWEREKIYFQALVNWLDENAHLVTLDNEWQVTYKSEAGTYSNQTDSMGYARGDVKRKAAKLDSLNIPYEIRRFGYDPETYEVIFDSEDFKLQSYHYGQDWNLKEKGYCLYAPLAPYQLDAIERSNPESLLDLAISCWKAGQNPKVLYPFMPDEIYNRSSRVVYGV